MARALIDSLSFEVTGGRERRVPERFAAFANGDEDDAEEGHRVRRERKAPARQGDGSGTKRMRCNTCLGCITPNCGKCVNCLDMPRFGGKGTIRQTCKMRACESLMEQQREEAMVRAVERAKEAEERAKQREAERHEREADRANAAAKRAADRALHREEKLIERDVARNSGAPRLGGPIGKGRGVRTPTVTLEEGLGGGWGEHPLDLGCEVEVRLEEEALEETLYAGKIVAEPGRKRKAGAAHADEVHVEFEELLESNDSDVRLREWTNRSCVRHKPPSTPRGFFGLLHRGDKLQLLYEDCWWDVQFDEVFRVSSLRYAKSHTVLEELLRPLWQWAPRAECWRYEIQMGHGCVGREPDAEPTFKFATGVGRSRCAQ